MSIRVGSPLGLLAVSAALSGCHSKPPASVSAAPPPKLAWRLSKTLLDVTVTYVPTNCEDVAGGPPKLDLDISVDVAARTVPDDDLGPDFPNGVVRADFRKLDDFWVDSNFSYKLYPDGVLQTLSSHSTGEGGTIIGNVLTGVVKIVATAAGVPAPFVGYVAPARGTNACGVVKQMLGQIKALQAKIPNEAADKATADAAMIVTKKAAITIVKKDTFDTTVQKPGADGVVGNIVPMPDDMTSKGWFAEDAPILNTPPDTMHVLIQLDFSKGWLLNSCTAGAATCDHLGGPLPAGTLFRQAAYVPVVARVGATVATSKIAGKPTTIAFGQFGEPHSLPIRTGAFKDVNWEVDLSEAGEVTGVTYASKSSGAAITSVLSGAATAASSLQQASATAHAAPDAHTAKLTKDNVAMQAQIDNAKLKAQVEALKAGQPLPDDGADQ